MIDNIINNWNSILTWLIILTILLDNMKLRSRIKSLEDTRISVNTQLKTLTLHILKKKREDEDAH